MTTSDEKAVLWKPIGVYEQYIDHPSKIYESTNLSAVTPPPPSYMASDALREVHRNARISTFQFETVRYICQCLSSRKTFFLGDGTGCGKGRMLSLIHI